MNSWVMWVFFMGTLIYGCQRPSKFVNEMEGFAKEVCECNHEECAKSVQAKYLEWLDDNHDARGSQNDLERTQNAMKSFAQCFNAVF